MIYLKVEMEYESTRQIVIGGEMYAKRKRLVRFLNYSKSVKY